MQSKSIGYKMTQESNGGWIDS